MLIWSIGVIILTGEKGSTRRKTYSNATFSTTNPTLTDLDANRGLRGEKLATNRLSYGTAKTVLPKMLWRKSYQCFCVDENVERYQMNKGDE
jgi:hypothetical protein